MSLVDNFTTVGNLMYSIIKMATFSNGLFVKLIKNSLKTQQLVSLRVWNHSQLSATYATKAEKKKGIDRRRTPSIEFNAQSIAAKGFLRPGVDYTPANDVEDQLKRICVDVLGDSALETKLGEKKCNLLMALGEQLGFYVPNSLLHQFATVADVVSFYKMPTCTKTPLDKLQLLQEAQKLPKNLNVQVEYTRWLPETDKKFGGVSVFPGSSTLVTGLKYRGKYKGHIVEPKYPRS